MLNNITLLQTALAPYAAAVGSGWAARLTSEAGTWEEGLVQQTANDLLSSCGLLAKLTAMRAVPATEPAAAKPGLRPEDLRPVLHAFFELLSSSQLVALFDKVTARTLRTRLRRDVLSVLSAAYARLHAEVGEPRRGYVDAMGGDVGNLLRQTPQQVDVLLGLR